MIASLESWTDNPPDDWDATICRLGGSIFHSCLWAEYRQQSGNIQPIFLLGRDAGGEACAGAVAFFQRSPWPIASLIFRTLTLPAHPVVRGGDDAAEAFIGQIEDRGRALGCSRIVLESFMSGESAFVPEDFGYRGASRLEFHLDLGRDPDSLWKGIGKDQRDKIRRLSREGVVIEEGRARDDIRGLGVVREATQAKRTARGQHYDLSAGDDFYERLFEYLVARGAGRLFLARRDGEVIAGLFFSTFNGHAYSVFSGSTDQGYRLGAQSGIFWAAVETFRAEGFALLNRGGVPGSAAEEGDPQHGIYVFKKRLGTTPVLCRSGAKVLSPVRDQLTRMRDRLRESVLA
ncbi:MAG: GNAT family N-acetyltransferase [Candidatus Accumulibacter sp.]|uniref:lipid II:glycine glycyltransferase FemX n=1 Tax=Accumulibacter sp. TaxID=2053492 RepID=UPI00258CD50D|nr:GNAT family N-acetyltransferase [Accumulibacter sp.]MCM8620681.1 GNAT family N-acetyltransferase [Accumulibacter sp.]